MVPNVPFWLWQANVEFSGAVSPPKLCLMLVWVLLV